MKLNRQLTRSEAYADDPTETTALWERGFRPCRAEEVQQGDRALVVQDHFLQYMRREFRFDGINPKAALGDPMHIHAYGLEVEPTGNYRLVLKSRSSTDSAGIAACLGLQAEAKVELKDIVAILESKMSGETIFTPL